MSDIKYLIEISEFDEEEIKAAKEKLDRETDLPLIISYALLWDVKPVTAANYVRRASADFRDTRFVGELITHIMIRYELDPRVVVDIMELID